MSEVNRQWCVARRPQGNVVDADFAYRESAIPSLRTGEFLAKTLYLNLAPVMRMYMSGESVAGEKPLAIGEVIHGRGVAEIIESKHPDYKVGDIVQGQMGWQTYKVSRATEQEKFSTIPNRGLPYSYSLSALGMTGFSAYFGFLDCGAPKTGDVVVISGAAGGVGSLVVQLAKIHGCHVIGIAGGTEKCRFVESLGCDASIDYKQDDVTTRIDELCPDGIDLYFDNVGGEILSTCLENLAFKSRVVLCGSISEYLLAEPFGLTNYTRLRRTNTTMQGFFVYNHRAEFPAAENALVRWVKSGKLKPVEDILDGFERMPEGLARLYTGGNCGVSMCRVRRGPNDTAL